MRVFLMRLLFFVVLLSESKCFIKNYVSNLIATLRVQISAVVTLNDEFVIDPGITMKEFLTEQQYLHESHTVTTKDGYILALDRIGRPSQFENNLNNEKNTNKPAVLIMHGLTSSSVDWVLIGPGRALPLLLADAGYDVWLGNNRGNTWSRKHVTLDPDRNEIFWDYSFHDLGVYDLPAFIDYILYATGQEQLSYIGHSQGCNQFLVLTSMLPEYNKKILVSALLAPPFPGQTVTQPFFRFYKSNLELIEGGLKLLGVRELFAHYRIYNKLAKYVCSQDYFLYFCWLPVAVVNGLNFPQVDTELLPRMMYSYPSSISHKQLYHYGQIISSDRFRQYDYGTAAANRLKYKYAEPPDYNISRISTPIGIFYSLNDVFANNVNLLSRGLPNVVLIHEISDKRFTHLDFIVAREVEKLLNVHVINLLNSYNKL